MDEIKLTDIKVEDRVRVCKKENIESLADSIHEQGLIHPILLTADNRLIAGEHRLEAFKLLEKKYGEAYSKIPYMRFEEYAVSKGLIKEGETIPRHKLVQLELEENIKRTSMRWQDRVLGIKKYHEIAMQANLFSAREDNWSQKRTAELFGFTQGYISLILRLGKRLEQDKNDPIWDAEGPVEAVNIMLKEQKDIAMKEMVSRAAEQRKTMGFGTSVAEIKKNFVMTEEVADDGNVRIVQRPVAVVKKEERESSPLVSKDTIGNIYSVGSCLEILPKMAGQFDHIITDPPYGIEMDNFMNAESVENVREEHKVEDNLELISKFIPLARECAKETSFMCMWYDLDHHEKIKAMAERAGWIVCRWPLVWCKTSPCINRAAAWNITKATEVCMMLRASPKAVLIKKRSENWLLADAFGTSKNHPFGKPERVWDWLIETVSFEGQTILDPFAGCGSSLYSIIKNKRVPLGIELKDEHVINGVDWLYTKLNGQ